MPACQSRTSGGIFSIILHGSYRHNYRTLLYLHWPYLLKLPSQLSNSTILALTLLTWLFWKTTSSICMYNALIQCCKLILKCNIGRIPVSFLAYFVTMVIYCAWIMHIHVQNQFCFICEPLFVVSCRYSFKHFVMHVKESKLTILLMICMEQFDLQCF